MLWLLASDNKDPNSGIIEGPDEKIAFRLRMAIPDFKKAIKYLLDKGFIDCLQDASKMLSNNEQNATPETETDSKEAETEVIPPTPRKHKITLEQLSVDHISDWLSEKRAQGRYLMHDENFILDQFKNYCQSKGKQYADYIAGYRNAFEWERCQPHANHPKRNKADRARDAILEGLRDCGVDVAGG